MPVSPEVQLTRLSHTHPLGGAWKPPELFVEKANVAGVDVWLAGLMATRADGARATGSAAERSQLPLSRAYGELLERTTILDTLASGRTSFDVFDTSRRCIGTAGADVVFPQNSSPDRVRYSTSNGTAAAKSWSDACERSRFELIERDVTLRSWYGQSVPVPLPLVRPVPENWRTHYDFEAYRVGESAGVNVCIVAGFPKRADVPLTLGFGARVEPRAAVTAAWEEAVQRLGFLWGEDIPQDEPAFSPTPDYHQAYYLNRETHGRLHAWLVGAHVQGGAMIRTEPAAAHPSGFVELGNQENGIVVVKCVASERLPLAFGRPHPWVEVDGTSPLAVHPIA